MNFIYEPIDFRVKRLGLYHQPKVRSVAIPAITPEEYIREQYIDAGRRAKKEAKQLKL